MSSNNFWNSATYKIVQAMKASGNQPGVVEQWKEMVQRWAAVNSGPDAAAVMSWLPHWQPRPFYTARELAPIFPALAVALRITDHLAPVKSARRLAHELDYAGLPTIQTPDWLLAQTLANEPYYIVERVHHWRTYPLTIEEFQEICNVRVPA
jgi:hypothetical protein